LLDNYGDIPFKYNICSPVGLFSWSHMPYTDELTTGLDIPSLSEMTGAALDFLQNKVTF